MQLAFMVSVKTECEDDSGTPLALKLKSSQRDGARDLLYRGTC